MDQERASWAEVCDYWREARADTRAFMHRHFKLSAASVVLGVVTLPTTFVATNRLFGEREAWEFLLQAGIALAAGLGVGCSLYVVGLVSAPARMKKRERAAAATAARSHANREERLIKERDALVDYAAEVKELQRGRVPDFAQTKATLDRMISDGYGLIREHGPNNNADEAFRAWIATTTSFVHDTFGPQQAARLTDYSGMSTPHSGVFAMMHMHVARLTGLRSNYLSGSARAIPAPHTQR